MSIAVSLIMPVYNAEKYLAESIESVLSQDLRNIELICVDDGSSDASPCILSSFAEKDHRLVVVRQQNKGAGAARNTGIDLASGEYIGFIDSDDLYGSESYLSTLYESAKRANRSISAARFVYYYGDNRQRDPSAENYYDGYSFQKDGVVSYEDYQFDYGFHRFIFSRDLFTLNRHRFSNLSYFEDPIWLVKILVQEGSFFACSSESYLYRIDHKPIMWTTGKVIDLLEGVQQNLLLSKGANLPKLHWYTVHHLDDSVHYAGIGLLDAFDCNAISAKLAKVEEVIDCDLLSEVDPADQSFRPTLRKQLEARGSIGTTKRKLLAFAFLAKRALAPIYHRLRARWAN